MLKLSLFGSSFLLFFKKKKYILFLTSKIVFRFLYSFIEEKETTGGWASPEQGDFFLTILICSLYHLSLFITLLILYKYLHKCLIAFSPT